MVFSCGALHQVTPMTRGKRYAFLAFLYGEADARLRELNNAKIAQSEFRYSGGDADRLFPGLARSAEEGDSGQGLKRLAG